VVAKNDFLSAIRLNAESGRLDSYDQFFRSEGHEESYVYINEMGNKCYFSDENANSRMQLYTLDKLGDDWSEPLALKGISDGISEANYPFMMTDGTTFYFASTRSEGLGGYDIYMTRFDSESGRFLKPENIGMPFNSEANDYMYAIDELDSIGYFVTDRRQPEGKVCVYTFIPNKNRRTYDPDDYEDGQLRSLARIDRIRDTWGNGQQRKRALARVKALAQARKKKTTDDIEFHVDDYTTYHSLSEFLLPDNRELYADLQAKQKKMQALSMALEKARKEYAEVSGAEHELMEAEILRNENEYYELELVIKQLAKNIRNAELRLMK
jgi:predicted transcriptional regulator